MKVFPCCARLVVWIRLLAACLAGAGMTAHAAEVLFGVGSNGYGGPFSSQKRPVAISADAVAFAVAEVNTYFIKADGTLWGMGDNASHQLGDSVPTSYQTEPVWIASSVSQVAVGGFMQGTHLLFVKTDGSLWAMGANVYGQLGDGSTTPRSSPVLVTADVARAAAGDSFSLFIKNDGSLWAMGLNSGGQLGDGSGITRFYPVQVATGVAEVAAGSNHSLFVKTNGSLWTVGSNEFGALGDGTTLGRNAPVQVASGVSHAAAGHYHSLFVKTDGTLWATGANFSGQLGDGSQVNRAVPVQVATQVDRVAAGLSHSVFLKTDGTVWAAGQNDSGQLGDGTRTGRNLPVRVATWTEAIAAGGMSSLWLRTPLPSIASASPLAFPAGQQITLHLDPAGESDWTYQWYRGAAGDESQPLSGATADTFTTPPLSGEISYWVKIHQAGKPAETSPVTVTGCVAPGIAQQPADQVLAANENADLTVSATGGALSYQWYEGTTGDVSRPVPGATGPRLFSLPLGASTSFWVRVTNLAGTADSAAASIAVTPAVARELRAMGDNRKGQLADGSTANRFLPSVSMSGVYTVKAGPARTLILKTDGTLWTAGSYGYVMASVTSPGTVTPQQLAEEVVDMAAVDYTTFYLKRDGTLWCAGIGARFPPGQLAGNVAGFAAGSDHVVFLKTDGSLWGFGLSISGQLGDEPTAGNQTTPVKIADDVKRISAGHQRTFFVKTDGTLWACGSNLYQQLGVVIASQSVREPVQVATGVADVFAGLPNAGNSIDYDNSHNLFLKTDGTLWGMGVNATGQLGDGTNLNRILPVQIATGVAGAAAGGGFSLFIKEDGSLWVTGSNVGGQLGTGATDSRNTPVQVAAGVLAAAAGERHSLFLVPDRPTITTQPADLVTLDGNAILTVVAESSISVAYQWYRGTSGDVTAPVAGAMGASLSRTGLAGGERFWVRLTNTTGITDSRSALVLRPPAIASQPSSVFGSNVAFPVVATGGELSYQWYRGAAGDTSQPIAGAASPTLVLPVELADGTFWVRITNAAGSADSAAITMTAPPPTPRHLTRAGSQNITGSVANRSVAVPVAQDVIRMSAGKSSPINQHFIKADGTLWGVGFNNQGQLGDGSIVARAVPVQIATEVRSVSSGGAHTLFVKRDGGLWGMGYNSDGQLGDGTTASHLSPVPVATGVAQASAGNVHSLFVKTDGTLWAMGNNAYGQLGDGTTLARPVPVKVADDVVYAAAGGYYSGGVSLFIKRDGTLWGMGSNAFGQLGGSGGGNRSTPTQIATGVTAAETGGQHTLILKTDGTLWGLGYNFYGQLGDGSGTNATTPVQIASSVLQAAAGNGNYSLFLKTDHSLWAMGDNSYGQFGNATATGSDVPILVAAHAWDISAGPAQSLRLVNPPPVLLEQPQSATIVAGTTVTLSVFATDSEALSYQWYEGANPLALTPVPVPGATSSTFTPPAQTTAGTAAYWVRVSNASNLVDSQVATVTTCALPAFATPPGSVTVNYGAATTLSASATGGLLSFQWYAGESGDTGAPVAGATSASYAVPAAATTDTLRFWLRATNIAGHADSPTAVVSVRPAILDQPDPARVPLGENVTLSVAAGGSAPLSYQWHRGASGDISQPVAGAVGATFTLSAPAAETSYWVRITNAVGAADSEAVDVVGVVAPVITAQPAPVGGTVDFGGAGIVRVGAAGGGLSYQWYRGQPGDTSSLVVGATGPLLLTPPLRASETFWVRAWNILGTVDSDPVTLAVAPAVPLALHAMGANSYGQLGLGSTVNQTLPARVAVDVVQAAAGLNFSLFVKADGTLWGMGYNGYGQLGTGSASLSPVKIADGVAVAAAGTEHALFLKYDGSLWSTGSNGYGQRGVDGSSTTPTLVTTGVARIAAGANHSLFLKTDGSLWGMGLNSSGQLGVAGTYISSPLRIAADVIQMAAGGAHSLFLSSDGSAWGMGHNGYGQLGDGTNTFRPTPVTLATGIANVAAGSYHSLFLKTDDTLWTTGYNNSGALGDGTTVSRNIPVQIATDVAMAAGDRAQGLGSGFTLFVKRDGTLWATGTNSYGQLGDGTTTRRLTPVQTSSAVMLAAAGGSHALFTRTPPPKITAQPAELGVVAGGSTSLHVETEGEGPIAYQWYMGVSGDVTQPVSGATAATFVTPAITVSNTYWVRVANAFGATDSASILVTVCTPPAITASSPALTLLTGQQAALAVSATGGVLSYQWYRGATGDTSTPLAGETGASLITAPLDQSGYYWVRVSNAAGTADSPATRVIALSRGELMAAGDNSRAQLALGFSGSITPAAPVATQVAKVAGGNYHTLFLKTDGTLWAVGRNNSGQLGDGTTTDRFSPVQVATGVAEIAAGGSHSLFVKTDGTAWAMGSNGSYQLGDGTNVSRSTPVQIATQVAKIAAGSLHTLLLKTDGTLFACGSKTSGQLGNGIVSSGTSTLVQVATGVAGIAAGASHSLTLKTDGSLWAAGLNSSGQLGDGTTTNRGAFVSIATAVAQVAAGGSVTWFVKTDGGLWTVGQGINGQLADGGTSNRSTPAEVASGVAQIAVGGSHGLFVKTDASLWAAGLNNLGQLGDGTRAQRTSPVQIADGVTQIAAGLSHSLFVTADGTLCTAGGNPYGQLGNGDRSDRPVPVRAPADAIAIAAGSAHTLFITADRTLWGVGRNDEGQLGDGSTEFRAVPVEIAGGVESVVAGPVSTFFIKTDGTLWAMGIDNTGHLGLGSPGLFVRPAMVADEVRQVATSGEHTLFVKRDGTLWAMGSNLAGQFGNRTTAGSNIPVLVASQVSQAAAGPGALSGYGFSAFLKTDGTLWTMGNNYYGQLGNGTLGSSPTSGQSTPQQIASDVVQVATGTRHLLFVKRDGILLGTGVSVTGELGRTGSFRTPIQVATQVTRVATGGHTLFLKQDGSLWATGPNANGQLGDGTRTTRIAPVEIGTDILDMAVGAAHSLFLRLPPPLILSDPSSVVARVGTRVEFAVTVTSLALPGVPLTYQWRHNGLPLDLPTASSDRLVIESAQLSDAGHYTVTVIQGGFVSPGNLALLTVHTEDQTTYAAWAAANAVSGNASDAPDGGGVPNLLRYAFKLPAHGLVGSPLTVQTAADAGGTWLAVTFKRKTYAPGLSYVVEASDDLVTWTGISTVQPGLPETVVARDTVPLSTQARRFLRVRVELAP